MPKSQPHLRTPSTTHNGTYQAVRRRDAWPGTELVESCCRQAFQDGCQRPPAQYIRCPRAAESGGNHAIVWSDVKPGAAWLKG